MAASASNTFKMHGLTPLYPHEAARMAVVIYKSQALVAGTLLGELTPVNDVQTVTVNGSPGGGTFALTVTVDGVPRTTAGLAYNISGANMQIALRALANINGANVSVSGDGPYTITFSGTLAGKLMPIITADYSLLTGGTSPTVTIVHTTPGIKAGTYKAYNDGNSDGSQTAKCILQLDCDVDSSGNMTMGTATGGGDHQQYVPSIPAFFKGTFQVSDLTGLDDPAVVDMGRMIEGTSSSGIFRLS